MRQGAALLFVLIVLSGLLTVYSSNAKAQSTNIYISPEGAVVGTNNIQRNGDLYVLTGNISSGIAVQKSNIILDGAGYTLQGHGGTGIDLTGNLTEYPSLNEIRNVTVENLGIMDFNYSVNAHGSSGNTFFNDYMGNITNDAKGGVLLYWNRGENNVTHCTIMGTVAIELSSFNTITENNLLGGIFLQLCGNETIDRNYWISYLTRYPNATEIDSSGIGNTPYAFDTYREVTGILQDNHPLINPISIANFGAPSPSPTPAVPEFPSLASPILFILMVTAGLLVCFKKYKRRQFG